MKWHHIKGGTRWRIEKKRQDKWVGAYHRVEPAKSKNGVDHLHIWICLVPCFPLHLDILILPRNRHIKWGG